MKTNARFSLTLAGLLFFSLISFNAVSQGDGEYHSISIDVDGLSRSYLLYEPEGHSGATDWPLVFLFHGYGGNSMAINTYTQLYLVADTAKFLLVCPQGLVVNDLIFGGTAPGWNIPANYAAAHDDIEFVNAMIQDLIDNPDFAVDTNRIHATGYSNGGEMAYYLACALSNRIASVGGVSSQMALEMMNNLCTPERQVSVLHALGTEDPFFPRNGDDIFPPLEGAAEYWADIDNCNTTPTETVLPDADPDDGSTVTLLNYEACDFGFEVQCYRIEGGGHCWPGTGGDCNNDFSASAEIWKFFLRNPHPDIYSCLPGGVIFMTQAEINNFKLKYPLCMEILGDVEISGSDIENLNGLNSINSIWGALEIYTSEDLEDLSGLNKLEYVDKDLQIFNNQGMESFSGLESLKHIGDDFVISFNNALENITSLDSLEYIGADLMIVSNEVLPELTGLDNVDTSSFRELTIKDNVNLTYCSVNSICTFISDPANQQDIDIKNNAPGCNNQEEVELDCVNATSGFTASGELFIHPNPFSKTTIIEFELYSQEKAELIIINHLGVQMQQITMQKPRQGTSQFKWNAESLPDGIYFCVLKTNSGITTMKMIKLD